MKLWDNFIAFENVGRALGEHYAHGLSLLMDQGIYPPWARHPETGQLGALADHITEMVDACWLYADLTVERLPEALNAKR